MGQINHCMAMEGQRFWDQSIGQTQQGTILELHILEDVDVSEKMSNPIPGRKITKEATKDFISLATSIDQDIFENEADDQKYYTGVLDKIEKIVDEAFPIRIAVPKVSKITPPWFTKGLAESSKCKKKTFCKVQEKAYTSK